MFSQYICGISELWATNRIHRTFITFCAVSRKFSAFYIMYQLLHFNILFSLISLYIKKNFAKLRFIRYLYRFKIFYSFLNTLEIQISFTVSWSIMFAYVYYDLKCLSVPIIIKNAFHIFIEYRILLLISIVHCPFRIFIGELSTCISNFYTLFYNIVSAVRKFY